MNATSQTREREDTAQREWRALIVDDHPLYRDGLADLIAGEPGVSVCGKAGDYAQALDKFRELKPDLVTVDISLTGGNGLDLVERIKALDPATIVLVVTMFEEGVYADRALAAGASGYVCKQAANDEVLTALRTIRKQGVFFSQAMMARLVQRKANGKSDAGGTEESLLSTRELQIFGLIGQGETTQKIAQQLHLSTSTVETYRERIKSKLNLANGAELTRRAILWAVRNT